MGHVTDFHRDHEYKMTLTGIWDGCVYRPGEHVCSNHHKPNKRHRMGSFTQIQNITAAYINELIITFGLERWTLNHRASQWLLCPSTWNPEGGRNAGLWKLIGRTGIIQMRLLGLHLRRIPTYGPRYGCPCNRRVATPIVQICMWAPTSHPLLAQVRALVLQLELNPIINFQAVPGYDHFPRNYIRLSLRCQTTMDPGNK